MSTELSINVTPRETRIAIIENGVLQEILVERTNRRGLVGNVYKGRISRVLPGMQAAFVDIGLERAAFLHVSDIASPHRKNAGREERGETEPNSLDQAQPNRLVQTEREDITAENITELLHEGQDLLVRVIKDPIGTKGARLATHISIPSCYLVYVPDADTIGVSQRIEDEEERERLRQIVNELIQHSDQTHNTGSHAKNPRISSSTDGYIIRTAAEGISKDKLRADMEFLSKIWSSLHERARSVSAPSIVHEDLPLVIRTMRELIGVEIEKVRIDSRETYHNLVAFTQRFLPEMVSRIEHYPGGRPIFDLYGVEDEIPKALDRKVQLKSGGHLVIDQTEAMTTIDVNTGAYVGHRNLEETIFKTNLEAAQAIARQLRLRNLGGIIIVDFIDMNNDDHKRQVLRALERSLEQDRSKTHISEVSSLGLVQMTRKRTRESLEHILCESCPTCKGRGTLKTPETVCYELFREILREARQFEAQRLLVLASHEVIDTLIDEESTAFAELEAFIGKPIKLQVESLYTQEQYDVVLM